jgi:hypothetical protein
MNEDKISKNVVNMKLQENAQEEDRDQDGKNSLGNTSHGRKSIGES